MRRLKELRAEHKMTQQELADRLNIDRTAVVKYETGKNGPSSEILQLMADIFDVTVDYLLERTDSRKPEQSDDELLRLLDDPINRGIFEKLKAMSPEARKVALAQLDALAKYPDREDKK